MKKKITCPKCGKNTEDIEEHVKKEHKEFKKIRIGNKVKKLEE